MTKASHNASTVSSPPIAPSLFDRVLEYSTALENGTVGVNKPLSDTTPIISFCQSFYAQFFDNVLQTPLLAIDAQMKEQAAAIRRRLPHNAATAPVRLLVAVFEELCDEWPEVLGLSYGFLRSDLLEFHKTFLPSLFEAINAWAKTLGNDALKQRAENAESAYAKGLAALNARLRKA